MHHHHHQRQRHLSSKWKMELHHNATPHHTLQLKPGVCVFAFFVCVTAARRLPARGDKGYNQRPGLQHTQPPHLAT